MWYLLGKIPCVSALLKIIPAFFRISWNSFSPTARPRKAFLTCVMSYQWRSDDAHLNETCQIWEWVMAYIWRSFVIRMKGTCHSYEWVMLQYREAISHTWMSHVTHRWMSHDTHTRMNCVTHMNVLYVSVMSHMWMTHVTHMSESCHVNEGVMTHIMKSHDKHKWVISHIWMSHVTHINESCHTYRWLMSHVTHMNGWCHENTPPFQSESYHIYVWVVSRIHSALFTCKRALYWLCFCRFLLHKSPTFARVFVRGDCNTLQHTATHCNILQHTATYCNTLQHLKIWRLKESANYFIFTYVYYP